MKLLFEMSQNASLCDIPKNGFEEERGLRIGLNLPRISIDIWTIHMENAVVFRCADSEKR